MSRALVAVLALVFVGACGGGTSHIDARGAALIDAQIAAARDAVTQHDYVRAETLLHAVEDSVNSLRSHDLVSDERAAAILSALGDTEDALLHYVDAHAPQPTTTATTTFVATRPSPPAPPTRHHQGKGHGDGGD